MKLSLILIALVIFKILEALQVTRAEKGCGNDNPVDECWQCNSNWEDHRKSLADCAIGFGRNTIGGQNGAIYVVTDHQNDHPLHPIPGTLRYGVIQDKPLWIIFDRDMHIHLKAELMVNSFKTIDGRGKNIHITTSITLQDVEHVIIHGIHVHDCEPTGPSNIRISPGHAVRKVRSEGDGITVKSSKNIWIDHNSFSNCTDGLLDVNQGSDSISLTNNYFSSHEKVMLLGHSDYHWEDRDMHVSVAFNYFGPGCGQRMPRCRLGTFHIFNNFYKNWGTYAIGGSANPTISSEGNYFEAGEKKKVTKCMNGAGNWRSIGDRFLNSAWFEPIGASSSDSCYTKTQSFVARPASLVVRMTANAGPLSME